MGGIFLVQGETLIEMKEEPYDSEDVLQELLARHPNLLAGDQPASASLRWLLVKRETGVPSREGGGGRWSLDHLFLDQNAVPTLVEVKRSDDTRIRREVVGQMLDYAANGVVYWPADRLRTEYEGRCVREGKDPAVDFSQSLGDGVYPEEFWNLVAQNLLAGNVRLVFVADEIPPELRRVIEFLNERMNPTEVIGIEVRQYVGEGGVKTLVPRVVGQTEQARAQKGTRITVDANWDYYEEAFAPERLALMRKLYEAIDEAVVDHEARLTPKFRRGYFGFQRPGEFFVIGVELFRERPIQLWIKLPLSPDELRGLGHDFPVLYPDLEGQWDAHNKQWEWSIPTIDDMPDVSQALALTLRYQPASGPMPVPTANPR